MKELVKNTVRYVSFDEPLLELVVKAVLLEMFDADVPPAAPARSAPASSAAASNATRIIASGSSASTGLSGFWMSWPVPTSTGVRGSTEFIDLLPRRYYGAATEGR